MLSGFGALQLGSVFRIFFVITHEQKSALKQILNKWSYDNKSNLAYIENLLISRDTQYSCKQSTCTPIIINRQLLICHFIVCHQSFGLLRSQIRMRSGLLTLYASSFSKQVFTRAAISFYMGSLVSNHFLMHAEMMNFWGYFLAYNSGRRDLKLLIMSLSLKLYPRMVEI